MERNCFTLQVKPGRIDDYVAAHRDVWPEMREALSRQGWHNYSLFLRDDGLLIGYVETPDFQKAVAGMQGEPINARWQAEMADMFEQLESDAPDTAIKQIQPLFYLV